MTANRSKANKRLEPARLALPVYSYACGRAAQAQRSATPPHPIAAGFYNCLKD
jgi:hypothetical protein